MNDKELRFVQSAIEAQRGGLGDLGKSLQALRQASRISNIEDLDNIAVDNIQVGETLKWSGLVINSHSFYNAK